MKSTLLLSVFLSFASIAQANHTCTYSAPDLDQPITVTRNAEADAYSEAVNRCFELRKEKFENRPTRSAASQEADADTQELFANMCVNKTICKPS